MKLISPLSETAETVTLSRADWDALLATLEDLQDTAAVAAHRAYEELVGRDAARSGYLTLEEMRRLLEWESPVKLWREKRGLSQRALADAAGLSPSYIAEIETGRKPGSAEAQLQVSRVLGVRMEDLAERDRLDMSVSYVRGLIDAGISLEQADAAARELHQEWHEIAAEGRHGTVSQVVLALKDRFNQLAADYAHLGMRQREDAAAQFARSFGSDGPPSTAGTVAQQVG